MIFFWVGVNSTNCQLLSWDVGHFSLIAQLQNKKR
jgi:hypothetical protein